MGRAHDQKYVEGLIRDLLSSNNPNDHALRDPQSNQITINRDAITVAIRVRLRSRRIILDLLVLLQSTPIRSPYRSPTVAHIKRS